jgi:hypothetical protein
MLGNAMYNVFLKYILIEKILKIIFFIFNINILKLLKNTKKYQFNIFLKKKTGKQKLMYSQSDI